MYEDEEITEKIALSQHFLPDIENSLGQVHDQHFEGAETRVQAGAINQEQQRHRSSGAGSHRFERNAVVVRRGTAPVVIFAL